MSPMSGSRSSSPHTSKDNKKGGRNNNNNRKNNNSNNNSNNNNSNNSNNNNNDTGDSLSASESNCNNDAVLQSIMNKSSNALVQPQITLTCYIPSQSVGAVIGRRGTTIAQIQRQAQNIGTGQPVRLSIVGHHHVTTGTNAATGEGGDNDGEGDMIEATTPTANNNVSNPSSTPSSPQPAGAGGGAAVGGTNSSVPYTYSELDWSNPDWTPVVIRADPVAALCAGKLVEDKVEELDQVVMDVPLSRSKHAALIGKRGLVLANLSADTNVRIMVPKRELRHDIIQLEGDLSNVKVCLERVISIITIADSKKQNKNSNNNNNNNNNNNANSAQSAGGATTAQSTTVITTTTSTNNNGEVMYQGILVVATLPSQTKLRSIGRKTETSIRKKKMDDEWQLIVTGSTQENVQSAVNIIKKWQQDNNNRNNNDNDNNNNNNNNNSNAASDSEQKNTNTPNRGGNRNRGGGGGRSQRGGKGPKGGGGRGKQNNQKVSPADNFS